MLKEEESPVRIRRVRPEGKKYRGHDGLVRCVEEDLIKLSYKAIVKFVNYRYGELDIYALKARNYVLLFEIKSIYRRGARMKAVSQLKRAKRCYFDKNNRVFKFHVYGVGRGEYSYEWIT